LYWRDDGSTDQSPAIVAEFAQRVGKGRCSHAPEDGQLRSTGSFLALLHTALRDEADYFAFSDQDDVWLPEKLAHAVAALAEEAADRPALYFCDRTLVDESLRSIGRPPRLRRPPGFPAALTQNIIPGCCMVLNRAAAELIDATVAPAPTWHDW
jgi:glycosyltransferase involved in cell wall biosynthesis